MQDLFDNIIAFLRAVLRFRWTALFVVWCIAAVGWSAVFLLDDVYQARAQVFVDSNRILKPLLDGIAVQPDVNQRIALMSKTLLSRPNLEKIVRMADLEADTDYERERQLNALAQTLSLRGTRGNDSLYTVAYRHTNRQTARRVVQAMINVFVESTIGDERKDSASAQAFLDSQLRDYEQRLAASERRLSDFKSENAGKMPGESGGYYQRLEVAKTRERATRLEFRESINRRDSLRRQLQNESPTMSEGGPNAVSPLESQLQNQQRELSALEVRFTDRHPRISQLRESVTALEQRLIAQNDSQAGQDQTSLGIRIASPIYQELRALLAESEGRVAELEVRVEAYSEDVASLDETIDTIPGIEARLKKLDRDYKVVKEQYDTLLERRESARLSEQVEQNVDDVKFRVIDPPFVPSRPASPDKPLLTLAVTAAAVGAGAGLAFLLSMFRPVFYDVASISRKIARPVLGTVSRQAELSGSRFWFFTSWSIWIGLLILLLAVFGLLMAIHMNFLTLSQFEPLLKTGLSQAFEFLTDLAPR